MARITNLTGKKLSKKGQGTVTYIPDYLRKYFKGKNKMFDVQRVGARSVENANTYLVKNMAEPELGYARIPEQEFFEWLDTLEKSKNKRRTWWRFYHYTDVGAEEYRMNMYSNFLTLVNFSSDLSQEYIDRLKTVLDKMSPDDWRRFTKKHEDLFNEVWDKYDFYAMEAIRTRGKTQALGNEDMKKLLEELEKAFL